MNQGTADAERVPAPRGAYSESAEAHGFYYTAGFGPHHPITGEVPETITEQTRQVICNLQAVLMTRGLTLANVVKATVHLSNLDSFMEFDREYEKHFSPPYPVRTTVGSRLRGFDVEIDIIAEVPQELRKE